MCVCVTWLQYNIVLYILYGMYEYSTLKYGTRVPVSILNSVVAAQGLSEIPSSTPLLCPIDLRTEPCPHVTIKSISSSASATYACDARKIAPASASEGRRKAGLLAVRPFLLRSFTFFSAACRFM